MEPFETNRDDRFQPDYENNCIELTGKRDVVEHAKVYNIKVNNEKRHSN